MGKNHNLLNARFDSEGYVSEMFNNISHIIQYSKSNECDGVLSHVYLCNVKEGVEEKVVYRVENTFGITALPLLRSSAIISTNQSFRLDEYLFLIGSLLRK